MPKAKLAVGKMHRVKPGEVVTGYQVNKNGTTTLLIEKKNRAANPKKHKPAKKSASKVKRRYFSKAIGGKVTIPGAKNPSVRKSKKTFKKFAKRLGVSLKKKLPRSLTHSKANKKRVVRKTKKR